MIELLPTINNARTEVAAASILRNLTSLAWHNAPAHEKARLMEVHNEFTARLRKAKRGLTLAKDELAKNPAVPNHHEPFDSAPKLHAVTTTESCPKCEKHKYPSCGPTVFASLLNRSIDETMAWLEDLNGKPLKRRRDHTASMNDAQILDAVANAGFDIELTKFDAPPRLQDLIYTVLANDESATYILFTRGHVSLLRTKGDGSFVLLDSGFLFTREPVERNYVREVKRTSKVSKVLRLFI